jgi:hypothetical protein
MVLFIKQARMKNQTATDWLFRKLWDEPQDKFTWYALLQEAKEIEKEQIIDAWDNGMKSDNGHFGTNEQYYNETYGK